MWFKRVLLAYCAASLAVTIVTAVSSKDATVPKKHHEVYRLTFPSLGRRQQPARNQTSLTEMDVRTSKDATSSSTPTSTEMSRSSTSAASTLAESLHGSISPSSSFSTPFEPRPGFASITPSSSNVDSSTPSLRSSVIELQSSQTSATVLPSFSQYTSSEQVSSSSSFDIASVTSPSTEEAQTTNSMETASSSNIESMPVSTMASETGLPSAASSPLSLTSASIPNGRNSQAQSDTIFYLISTGVTFLTSIEPRLSTVSAPASFTFITVSPSEMISTSVLTSQPSATATTSIEHYSSAFSGSSFKVVSMSTSTRAVSATTSSAQAPISSSIAATPVAEGQTSSSSVAETSSSAAPEVAAPDSARFSSIIQTPTNLDGASSKLVISAFESISASVSDFTTSSIEEIQPAPSSSILATPAVSAGSMEQALSSISVDPTTTGTYVLSWTIGHPSGIAPSSPALVPTSSSKTEQELAFSQELGLSTSTFNSETSSSSSDPTTSESSSLFPAATAFSSPITAQLPRFSSETSMFTSSLVEAMTTVSVSLVLTSSTLVLSPTFVETGASVSTSSEATTTSFTSVTLLSSASLGTNFSSSFTTGSELASSILPSETLVGSALSSMVTSSSVLQILYPTVTFSATQSGASGSSPAYSTLVQSPPGAITASEKQVTNNQTSSVLSLVFTGSSILPTSGSSSISGSLVSSLSQTSSLRQPTSVATLSTTSSTKGAILTSETADPSFVTMTLSYSHTPLSVATFSGISSFTSLSALTSRVSIETPLPSSIRSNATQTTSSFSTASRTITATLSTVYISSARSFVLDLSTVTFSLLSSATVAAVNQTNIRNSSIITATTLQGSGIHVSASESLASSTMFGHEANSTWRSPLQPSWTATSGSSGSPNTTRTSTAELGITHSRSTLPTGTTLGSRTVSNATQAETLQTSSEHVAVNPTTADLLAFTTSASTSDLHLVTQSSAPASSSSEASTTDGAGTEDTNTSAAPYTPTSSPSQTAAVGSTPPLTTSQTAGVAVGATTGLLIAVVAAIFIARRYYAAKHGKGMITDSVYPEIAYLYDPKTGRYGGDAEALMSSMTNRPSDHASRPARGFSGHMQRHSTGTIPVFRLTKPANPFTEAIRDPAIQKHSEYARIDTTRALSAAVAGYSDATKYPSDATDPFSDHVIPSPTFAPFSPDDIRRPELKTTHNRIDGRGDYSQMSVNPYAYLNTLAPMYPPVSPYEHPSTPGPSLAYNTRRQTIDSDPFADPFEHDLLLHVDEQNRTSDSMTIFAPSPNSMPPRTPVRQLNGMTSGRSLLSPVVAKHLHEAQVKILQKSVASPVLVQVGRSPVIQPSSPPPAAPEPLGWNDIKRNSEKHFFDKRIVPAPLKFASPVIKKKPVPISHTRTKPSLTGAGQTLLAGNGLPLAVKIPHRYSKSVGLDVPRAPARPDAAHEGLSSDPVVREKRSRELRFADPALIGKQF